MKQIDAIAWFFTHQRNVFQSACFARFVISEDWFLFSACTFFVKFLFLVRTSLRNLVMSSERFEYVTFADFRKRTDFLTAVQQKF